MQPTEDAMLSQLMEPVDGGVLSELASHFDPDLLLPALGAVGY